MFVERDGRELGRQLLLVLFESEAPDFAWLNNLVCVGDGAIDPVALTASIEIAALISDI